MQPPSTRSTPLWNYAAAPGKPSAPAATSRQLAKGLSRIAALRALRQVPGEGLLDRAGALSHERLFGANRLWFSRRPGQGLRRRGRDHLRRERDRPASARLWPWSVRLRPEALSGAPRAKTRRLGPSGSLAELDTSGT